MWKEFILKAIKFYQVFISPFLGKHCRFYPSCSEYFCLAVEKYGIIKGSIKWLKRLFKCHPGSPGGIDFP